MSFSNICRTQCCLIHLQILCKLQKSCAGHTGQVWVRKVICRCYRSFQCSSLSRDPMTVSQTGCYRGGCPEIENLRFCSACSSIWSRKGTGEEEGQVCNSCWREGSRAGLLSSGVTCTCLNVVCCKKVLMMCVITALTVGALTCRRVEGMTESQKWVWVT